MKKIEIKDFVSIGIFSALFIAFVVAIASIQVIPILAIAMPPIMALFTGPIFLLFVARTGKPYCISIMGLIVSLVIGLLVFGNVFIFMFNLLFFVLADIIAASGQYKSAKINLISYVVLSLWVFGENGAYWVAQDWMMKISLTQGMAETFVNEAFALATPMNLFILVLLTLVCSFVSGLIAKIMFKKHFKRAGMV